MEGLGYPYQYDPVQYGFEDHGQQNHFLATSSSAMPQMNTGFDYPMHGIEYPGLNDVMCGRGKWFAKIVRVYEV